MVEERKKDRSASLKRTLKDIFKTKDAARALEKLEEINHASEKL